MNRQKKTAVSVTDVLNNTVVPTAQTGAQDVTGFVLNEKGIPVVDKKENYPLVNATIKAIATLNSAKTTAELNKSKMSELALPVYDSLKGATKSVKFRNAKGTGIIVTYSDTYKLAEGTEQTVKDTLGDKQFNENFSEKYELSAINPSKETVVELEKLIGEDKFNEMFSVTREVVPTKGMDVRFNTLPEVVRKSLVQNKPKVSIF